MRGDHRRTASRLALLAMAGTGGGAGFAPALAQGVEPVQDIIVTAQRRAQRLEDVPLAIVSISPQTLERSGVTGLKDIGRVAPGVQINFAGSSTQPAIRGVTTLTNGNGVENNVAIYVDGFYEPNNIAINSELLNVSGIEVLKGPQGTLYGRNATGGAILINTLAPAETLTGRVQARYGNFDDRSVSGYLSGPVSQSIRFGIAGFYRKSDGWIALTSPTEIGRKIGNAAPIEQGGLRTKLEIDVTETLTATLAYNYGYTSDPHANYFGVFDHVSPALPAPPGRSPIFGTAGVNYPTKLATTTHQGTLKLALETPVGTLSSYTGYTRHKDDSILDFDGSYADLSSLQTLFFQDTWQQSADLNVDTIDGFNLIVGGLYYDDDFRGADGGRGVRINGANRQLLLSNRPQLRTKAWAIYADATWDITGRLSLNAGGRYSHDDKRFTFSSQAASGAFVLPPTTREADFGKFTPRASLRYEIAPRTNVYATVSRGFRAGSFNPSGASNAALLLPIESETITAYEAGFKTAGRRVRLDAAIFYYDYKNLNVAINIPNPTCPAGQTCPVVSVFGNAPKAEIYGADALLVIEPIDRLNLSIGGAYLHARYKEFPNATGTGLNAATDLNVTGQVQDWSGQQMARAPTFSGNVGADYTVDAGGGALTLSGAGTYSDSYVINNASLFGPLAGAALANRQRYRQKKTFLLNGQISWQDASRHYTVAVFGNNLTDVTYRDTYTGSVFGDYSTQAQPRTYGVRVGYQF